MDWDTIKNLWPIGAVFGGYVVRTESVRAVLRRDVESLQKRQEHDRNEIKDSLRDIKVEMIRMHGETRDDLKELATRIGK